MRNSHKSACPKGTLAGYNTLKDISRFSIHVDFIHKTDKINITATLKDDFKYCLIFPIKAKKKKVCGYK